MSHLSSKQIVGTSIPDSGYGAPDDDELRQLPTVIPQDNGSRAVAAWAGDKPAYASNLNPDSDEYQHCALAFVGEADSRAEEVLAREIKVVGVLGGWRTLGVNPDGEIVQGMAVVILTEDGGTISITANGPVRVLGEILRQRGMGVWDPPVSIWLKAISCGEGKRRFSLTATNVRSPKNAKQAKK